MSNEEKDLKEPVEIPAANSGPHEEAARPAAALEALAPVKEEPREAPSPNREEEFPSGPVAPHEDVPQPVEEEPQEQEDDDQSDDDDEASAGDQMPPAPAAPEASGPA